MKQVKIFFTSAYGEGYTHIKNAVQFAVNDINNSGEYSVELRTSTETPFLSNISNLFTEIQEADLIISNITYVNANVFYELGIIHAFNKPSLILAESQSSLPFDLSKVRYFIYDHQSTFTEENEAISLFSFKLSKVITEIIEDPNNWKIQSIQKQTSTLKTLFVSYSHNDTIYLDRLKIHLKPLERMSLIQLWSDTLIQSGDKWKLKIEKALDKSVIAILLVSADFLASDFIVNNELQPLLKAAEQKGTIIIPVIIKPCRFLREHSISQFQAINDPTRPLCKLNEYEQEDIYERLSQRIELALQSEV